MDLEKEAHSVDMSRFDWRKVSCAVVLVSYFLVLRQVLEYYLAAGGYAFFRFNTLHRYVR